MPVDANGEMEDGEQRQKSGDEDRGLERMVAGAGFGEVAESGEETGAEEEKKDGEIPEDREEIEPVAGARVGDGLLVFLGREMVGAPSQPTASGPASITSPSLSSPLFPPASNRPRLLSNPFPALP